MGRKKERVGEWGGGAKKQRTDKVGLVLSECHVWEAGGKCSCSKTERHPRILNPVTVDSFIITH